MRKWRVQIVDLVQLIIVNIVDFINLISLSCKFLLWQIDIEFEKVEVKYF